MVEIYDLLILGAGPAGMSAAIYAGRYGMKTLIIGKEIGGTTNLAGEFENYPGFTGSGIDLMKKFEEQVKTFGAVFEIGSIDKLEKVEEGFCVSVGDKKFVGSSVISGLGSERRKLGIPGEGKFLGKGVSYCATCDGNFFRGKIVAVIGGSDSAAKAAIYLASICEKVYISYRKEKMRCEPINLEKIEAMKNIEIIYNSKPLEIVGDKNVNGLKLESLDGAKLVDVDGVFIEVGSVPLTVIFDGLGVELENGYIKVDKEGRTSVEGLFAAGDGTNNPFKQTITAAADGVLATRTAYNFVKLGKK
ncbi:FAD-dependent oxidoreductase [Candidatus Pacearchaeota archaeon]|nr:FAD-dependent oxidoreductase [Candidatus Pacearchaeota archaeon]